MLCALLFLSFAGDLPQPVDLIKPTFVVDGSSEIMDQTFFKHIYDAAYSDGQLFLCENGRFVIVYGKKGFVRQIGESGREPHQFSRQPSRVDLVGETLQIYSANRQLSFDKEGKHLETKPYNFRNRALPDGTVYRALSRGKAMRAKALFETADKSFRFGFMEGLRPESHYLQTSVVAQAPSGEILVVKRRGVIERWDKGEKKGQIELDLSEYTRDMEIDRMRVEAGHQGYRFGLPLAAAVVESDQVLWLLLQNEKLENAPSQLLRMDLEQGKVTHRYQAKREIFRIKINDGHLLTLVPAEPFVGVYNLKKLAKKR